MGVGDRDGECMAADVDVTGECASPGDCDDEVVSRRQRRWPSWRMSAIARGSDSAYAQPWAIGCRLSGNSAESAMRQCVTTVPGGVAATGLHTERYSNSYEMKQSSDLPSRHCSD